MHRRRPLSVRAVASESRSLSQRNTQRDTQLSWRRTEFTRGTPGRHLTVCPPKTAPVLHSPMHSDRRTSSHSHIVPLALHRQHDMTVVHILWPSAAVDERREQAAWPVCWEAAVAHGASKQCPRPRGNTHDTLRAYFRFDSQVHTVLRAMQEASPPGPCNNLLDAIAQQSAAFNASLHPAAGVRSMFLPALLMPCLMCVLVGVVEAAVASLRHVAMAATVASSLMVRCHNSNLSRAQPCCITLHSLACLEQSTSHVRTVGHLLHTCPPLLMGSP